MKANNIRKQMELELKDTKASLSSSSFKIIKHKKNPKGLIQVNVNIKRSSKENLKR